MRCSLPVAVFLLLSLGALGELPPLNRSYNILMLLPTSSRSHRNVFTPFSRALEERGHKVTMLSNHPTADKYPNIRYVEHGLEHFREENMDVFEMAVDPTDMFEHFETIFPKIAKDLYSVPEVKELYDKRKEFDVFIIDHLFNEATFPFVHEQPFIILSPGKIDPAISAMVGNLQNPAYVANMLDEYPRPFSFLNRIKNIFFSIVVPLQWNNAIVKPTQVEISKMFPHLPPLVDIQRNQSLTLINSHFSLDTPLPLLPSQVEVGGMHLRPPKPLPKDISDFLAGSTPVVYMSLGSVARSSNIPKKAMTALTAAFSKLPYKVLWKFEEEMPNLPKNVFIKKWMPQIDILAHPNVKVFISHCGLLGTQEALYHGKPILGLPIFGDQPKNAKGFENSGLGRYLKWDDLTEQLVTNTIKEMITNPSYAAKAAQASATFRDQPETPTERAVYWTEYVVRHRGATHLRSPERDLSWIELLHLDILALFHVSIFLICRLVKFFFKLCFGAKKPKAGKNKNKRD